MTLLCMTCAHHRRRGAAVLFITATGINFIVRGRRGRHVIPHRSFWDAVVGLVADGARFSRSAVWRTDNTFNTDIHPTAIGPGHDRLDHDVDEYRRRGRQVNEARARPSTLGAARL